MMHYWHSAVLPDMKASDHRIQVKVHCRPGGGRAPAGREIWAASITSQCQLECHYPLAPPTGRRRKAAQCQLVSTTINYYQLVSSCLPLQSVKDCRHFEWLNVSWNRRNLKYRRTCVSTQCLDKTTWRFLVTCHRNSGCREVTYPL